MTTAKRTIIIITVIAIGVMLQLRELAEELRNLFSSRLGARGTE